MKPVVGDVLRRIRQRLSDIPLAGSGQRVALSSGRIVRVRPLNLERALLLLGVLGELVERVGWEQLAKLSLVPALFTLAREGPEVWAEVLALLTGEPGEVVLSEFSPGDTVRVMVKAWEQEFAKLPLSELGRWLRGSCHV